jgi:high-affinity nickel-transport protein
MSQHGGREPAIALSGTEKAQIGVVYFLILLATIGGLVASSIVGKMSILLAGFGIIAYIFGLRHGLDADHIAAIDNTTRKLMQGKQRPFTVGLWFSLRHSTIVVGLIISLVFATKLIVAQVPVLQQTGAIIGTAVSGLFLWLMGIVNLMIVFSIYNAFKEMKKGKMNHAELDRLLEERGFMNRYLRPLFRIVKRPWQMYPIGVLFGLGFDTASEIALIAVSVGIGVSSVVPLWMILVLPFMFTCGMVLVDTSDGIAMRVAYGWAFLNPIRKIYYNLTITVIFLNPIRKIYYNLTITVISVLVALVIGTAELLQVLASELNLTGAYWSWLTRLDFETIGLGIVMIFLLSWLVSFAVWKRGGFDRSSGSALPESRIRS